MPRMKNGEILKLLKELLQNEIKYVVSNVYDLKTDNKTQHDEISQRITILFDKVQTLREFKIKVLTTATVISGSISITVSAVFMVLKAFGYV